MRPRLQDIFEMKFQRAGKANFARFATIISNWRFSILSVRLAYFSYISSNFLWADLAQCKLYRVWSMASLYQGGHVDLAVYGESILSSKAFGLMWGGKWWRLCLSHLAVGGHCGCNRWRLVPWTLYREAFFVGCSIPFRLNSNGLQKSPLSICQIGRDHAYCSLIWQNVQPMGGRCFRSFGCS